MTESRFRKVIQKVTDWVEHSRHETEAAPNSERFVMKPGEVRVIKGGGAQVDRAPGEKRGE